MFMGKDMEGWWLYPVFLVIVGDYVLAVGAGIGLSAWVIVPLGAFIAAVAVWMTWDGYSLRRFCIEQRLAKNQPKR